MGKKIRAERYEKEAIDFVLSNIPEKGEIDEHQWVKSIDKLHPFSLGLISPLGIKNVTLIAHGVRYADRKKILEGLALELRVAPSSVLEPASCP